MEEKICPICNKKIPLCSYYNLVKYHPQCKKKAHKNKVKKLRMTPKTKQYHRNYERERRRKETKEFNSLTKEEQIERMNKKARYYLEKPELSDELKKKWKSSQKKRLLQSQ